MARITVEDCISVLPSRFELVLLAAHRARQLASDGQYEARKGAEPKTVRALRDIAEGSADVGRLREDFVKSLQSNLPEDDPSPEDELLQLDLKALMRQARVDGSLVEKVQKEEAVDHLA